MMTPEKYDQLLALFHGQLPSAAREELEAELQANPSLQADYEDLILIERLAVEHKIAEVETISQQAFTKHKKRERIKKGAIVLVGLLGIAAVSYYFYPSPEKTSTTNPVIPVEVLKPIVVEPQNTIEPEKESLQKVIKTEESEIQLPAKKEIIKTVNNQPDTITPATVAVKQEIETKKTPQPVEENPEPTIPLDPCVENPLQVTVSSQSSCPDEATGKVIIKIIGGTPPVSQKIIDLDQNEYGTHYLISGNYQAIITDNKHCKSVISFTIDEKICAVDYEFNPSQGQTLHLNNISGLLQVRTKTGQLYYETIIDETDNFEWDGRNNSEALIPGFYTYRILSKQKEVKFGTITITQ